MKKSTLIIIMLLCCAFSYAQKEAANWYFGNNAGISFDIDTSTVTAINDGQLITEEGCTTISNSNGDLLFYTNGEIVYDRLGNIMPNGTGLLGNQSSTQSAIIIPKPGDLDIYYIFTQDTQFQSTLDSGFSYSEVNMALNNGFGDVVTTSKNTQLLSSATEKLSAVLKDCQTANILVATQVNGLNGNDLFYIYEVSNTNITLLGTPSNTGFSTNGNGRGYLKFSPDGTKLVSANVRDGLYVYDFDVNTGTVSPPTPIIIPNSNLNGAIYPYGIEFSPNGEILYVSTYNDFFIDDQQENNNPTNHNSALLQYDLSSNDFNTINASVVPLEIKQGYRSALQLGPDGKIYKTESQTYDLGLPNLSTIEAPNTLGTGCNYTLNTITLTSNARQGLPPFITSFFSEDIDIIQNGTNITNLPLCIGDTYTLIAEDIPGAIYTWTQDDLPLAENDFDLVVTVPGTYKVEIEVIGDSCGLLEGVANVFYFEVPVATQPEDIKLCDDNNDGLENFDFSTQTNSILNGQDPSEFQVSYYASQADADVRANQLPLNYQNTLSTETIFIRIENVNNTNCADTTLNFEIEVFSTPIISDVNDLNSCDTDANPMDGQTEIILSNFNTAILGSQDATQFTITYHTSQTDADDGNNTLNNNYTNQTPFTETLFIRIENNNNTNCYTTGSIDLVINPLPEAFDTAIYQCDEQGMVDGFTTFNLTEVNADITGNTPDTSTQFYPTLNDAENNINEIDGNAFNNTSNPQTIYVRVTNDLTDCFNFSTLTLETSDTQINNYTAQPVCDELDSEDGLNAFNLDEFSTDILAGLPTGLDIAYYETENDALIENNALSSPYQNTTPYAQTIYVRVENDNACYGINEVFLTVNPLPILDNDETLVYCLNNFPTTLNLNAGLNDTAANYSFNWSTSETTETIAVNTVGTYTVTVTNNNTFCSNNRTIIVEPSNIATIDTIEIIDGSINNNVVTIITSGEGDYQYALTDQDQNTTPFQSSNVFTQISPGIYNVIVRDVKNNCGSINQDISVIGFPLFFTPNGDTFNDTWQVYGVSNVFQPNSKILIFNRFGKLITQIKPTDSGWDGTFNGKPLPQSDYWFSVKLQDGREYKNHFTLRR